MEKTIIKFNGESERIDKYLATTLEGFTRSELKNYFNDQKITVNGKIVLSPRGHLERQAEFHASTHDEA